MMIGVRAGVGIPLAVVGNPLVGVGIPLTGMGVAIPDDIMLWQVLHSHMPTI